MRRTGCSLLILILVFLSGCDLSDIWNSDDDFHIIALEHPAETEWEEATYYQASGGRSGFDISTLEEVKQYLRSLRARDITVPAAWYRKGTPSCGALTVITPPTLAIRTAEPVDPGALGDAFEVKEGKPQFCVGTVYRLVPEG